MKSPHAGFIFHLLALLHGMIKMAVKTSPRHCPPFEKEPDFKATSVNYDLSGSLAQSKEPA